MTRTCPECRQPLAETHGLILHDNARIVIGDGKVSDPLSPNEYELVRFLVLHFGQHCSADRIASWLYQNGGGPECPTGAISTLAQRAAKKLRVLGLSVCGAMNGDGWRITWIDKRQTEAVGNIPQPSAETWT